MEKKYEIIYKDIFNSIRENTLAPGDRIPTEHEIMAKYGVSRTTARHAVKKLEQNQLIFRTRKVGSVVTYTEKYKEIKKNTVIALILPDTNTSNMMFAGIQDYAIENKCLVSCYDSLNSSKKERELLIKLCDMNMPGLIIWPCSLYSNIDVYSALLLKGVSLTFIDRGIPGIKGSLVTSDNYQSMYDITSRVIQCGHKKIGFCAIGNNMLPTEIKRLEGFCAALVDNNINYNYNYVMRYNSDLRHKFTFGPIENQTETFEAFVAKSLEKYQSSLDKPTCICCLNDVIAIRMMMTYRKAGVRIPEDLSIVGFDNISNAKDNSLTTVQQRFYELGSDACKSVLNYIRTGEPTKTYIPADIIMRGSLLDLKK